MRVFFGLFVAGLALIPALADARLRPSVTARFETASESVPIGATVDVILRLTAAANAPDVTAEISAPAEVDITGGSILWSGALTAGDSVAIPLRARFIGAGEYTLGARVTNRAVGGTQVSGAILYVTAAGQTAELSARSHFATKLARATTAADLTALGVAAPTPGPAQNEGPGLQGVSGTVHGTVRWTDPEGNTHFVRGALVQIFDGPLGGPLLANTATGPDGRYSAAVSPSSNQVSVHVYTVDWNGTAFGTIVEVTPEGQPNLFYGLAVGPVAMTSDLSLDLTTPRPQRGTPGHPDPTPNTAGIRAFSVFDGMRTYWYQATALLGRDMPTSLTTFPYTGPGVTKFDNPRTFVSLGDAYNWDTLGHEFMHFLNFVFSNGPGARPIANSPAGPHAGGSAIGENGRNRDEGMRLAWSEGLASALSLMLQEAPLPSISPFPTDLLNLANGSDDETEDAVYSFSTETPSPNDGFACELSITGMFWDLFDTAQDAAGSVTDTIAGVRPKLLWDMITTILPCNPCDRVDRFWSSLGAALGFLNPAVFQIAREFVINNMAPRTTAPADGSAIGGGVPPTFEWIANGDPHPDHENDSFVLVFSRDNFNHHLFVLTAPKGAASYTPTPQEWLQLQQGGSQNDVYQWFVAGFASPGGQGNPQIPEGLLWFSDMRSFTVRSLHIQITWTPLGADVDLHLQPPSGTDIAYYNRDPGWGVLDRDCITSCTEENISVARFPETGVYRAFAHYYSDHGMGATTVRAQVFVAGQAILDQYFTLGETGDTHDIFSVYLSASADGLARALRIRPSDHAGRYDGPPLPRKPGR
jgi:hypothetical protein